jgi:hypothetical protein
MQAAKNIIVATLRLRRQLSVVDGGVQVWKEWVLLASIPF